ncbi:MAG: ABC transporter substrate-binding protein [Geitlerinemataceae cyanobacterium]
MARTETPTQTIARWWHATRQMLRDTARIAAIALCCAIALGILSGCSLEDFRVEPPTPQIVIGALGPPKTFNAALSKESPNVFGYIYTGLLETNGGNGDLEPSLAESWEISEDNLQVRFTLREGLQWSDGEPLTADDVVFTFQKIYANEAIPTSTRDVLRVGESGTLPEVRKVDDRTVDFILPEPFSPILRSLTTAILPKHALEAAVDSVDAEGTPAFNSTWDTKTPPEEIVASGPYTLKEYVTGQRVTFDRNPNYWKQEDPDRLMPYIGRFVWEVVENQDTQLFQFRAGNLSTVSVAPQYFSLLKREEDRGDFTIYEDGPALGTTFITFNLNRATTEDGTPLVDPIKSEWFNTLDFRKAVAHGLNRQRAIDNIYRGLGELQHSPISIQSPFYLPPEKGLPTYDYDPEKSRELLAGAGFTYDDSGQLFDKDGNRVSFSLITNAGNQVREALGAQIKQDLSEIGIEVNFTPIDFNNLVGKLTDSLDWECHLLGFTGGIEPHGGSTIWSVDGRLHSFNQDRADPPIVGREVSDWEQEIADLYVAGSKEFDEAKRYEIYSKTQIVTQEQLPYIYLVNPLSMSAIRDNIENVKYSALGGAFWNLHELDFTSEIAE